MTRDDVLKFQNKLIATQNMDIILNLSTALEIDCPPESPMFSKVKALVTASTILECATLVRKFTTFVVLSSEQVQQQCVELLRTSIQPTVQSQSQIQAQVQLPITPAPTMVVEVSGSTRKRKRSSEIEKQASTSSRRNRSMSEGELNKLTVDELRALHKTLSGTPIPNMKKKIMVKLVYYAMNKELDPRNQEAYKAFMDELNVCSGNNVRTVATKLAGHKINARNVC